MKPNARYPAQQYPSGWTWKLKSEKTTREFPPEKQFNEKQLEGIFQLFAVNGNALVKWKKLLKYGEEHQHRNPPELFGVEIAMMEGKERRNVEQEPSERMEPYRKGIFSSWCFLFLLLFPLLRQAALDSISAGIPNNKWVGRDGRSDSDSRSPTQLGYGRRSYPLKWMEIGAGKKEWKWWRLQVAVPSNFAESDAWSSWRIAPLLRNVFAFKLWFRLFFCWNTRNLFERHIPPFAALNSISISLKTIFPFALNPPHSSSPLGLLK